MYRWAFISAVLLLAVPLARADEKPARGLAPGKHVLTLEAAGQKWTYRVHVPAKYDSAKPTPLVLILHGAGGSGEGYLDRAGWAKKADAAGFIAVAPDGLPIRPDAKADFLTNPRVWNTGQLRAESPRAKIDDLAFFRSLLDTVEKQLNVDKSRVYVTGHSNGAGMTFRLGTELSERFTALAPVASHVWAKDPKPARPLPTLYIVGTNDPLIPLAGGERTLPWGKSTVPPVHDSLTTWAKALGCPTTPKTIRDKDGVKIVEYGPGKDGVKLTVWFITGQGHNWPGGRMLLPAKYSGPDSDKVDATKVIQEFFEKHERKP
jgi:polyhydroxybutyrate depolymerase